MARFFYVRITQGNSPGPFDIYWDAVNPANFAIIYDNDEFAQNVSYKDLTLVNNNGKTGLKVYVPDQATSIIVEGTNCGVDIDVTLSLVTPTPTPTPTISLTPTNTPTISLTPTNTPSLSLSNTPTPTVTPTSTPLYAVYLADEYDCNTCTVVANNVSVELPIGATPNYSNWYAAATPSGFVYKLTSTSSGTGLLLNAASQASCAGACSL